MQRVILTIIFFTSLTYGVEDPTEPAFNSYRETEAAQFVISVEKDDYQALLNQLPIEVIEIDVEAITDVLARRIGAMEIEFETDEARKTVATELCQNVVVPILEDRVEKFNDLFVSQVKEDKVSAGLIAFGGLAKSMTESSQRGVSSVQPNCKFNVRDQVWEWWDSDREKWLPAPRASTCRVSGVTNFNRHLSGEINEEIEFDLSPYGTEKKFTLTFTCDAKVVLEQVHSSRFVWNRKNGQKGIPYTKVRVKPRATVVATKTINAGSYFRIVGEESSYFNEEKEAVFEYPATLEFEVEAPLP